MQRLGIHKLDKRATMPKYGTDQAACFDLYANIPRTYDEALEEVESVQLAPGERTLVPTGLVFDIPEGYSVRLHSRSGWAYKYGIILANCEGIIDSDYVEEIMVMLTNISDEVVYIRHGDRICQGELVKDERVVFDIVEERPVKKTNRDGGFGSTGD